MDEKPFGPEYQKIQTLWKRDEKGVILPGEYTLPELEYLSDLQWMWHEKIDGTNIRLHWDGSKVTIGGRTDRANVPPKLVLAALSQWNDPGLWKNTFPDAQDDVCFPPSVTIYGEGYGAGIQKGGNNYRLDQGFIVFDIRVGKWWLKELDVRDICEKMGMERVPFVYYRSLAGAWQDIMDGMHNYSAWDKVQPEGLVGRPIVPLYTRSGERIIVKMKHKDWLDYNRSHATDTIT